MALKMGGEKFRKKRYPMSKFITMCMNNEWHNKNGNKNFFWEERKRQLTSSEY